MLGFFSFFIIVLAGSTTAIPTPAPKAPRRLFKRDLYPSDCSQFLNYLTSEGAQGPATTFCSQYLGIITRVQTSISYTATAIATQTISTLTFATTTNTPAFVWATATSLTTSKNTIATPTATVTQQTTQTAYLDNAGSTIAVMKRDLMPTPTPAESTPDLEKRLVLSTPSAISVLSYNPFVQSGACSCLSLTTPYVTEVIYARATSVFTEVLSHTHWNSATAAAPTSITTLQITKVENYIPAPTLTTTVVDTLLSNYACPPGYSTDWTCPPGTGTDNSTQPQQIDCSVEASDGYQGDCIYWDDDGSPAGSTLYLPNSSGNPNTYPSRSATYGNDANSDCPAWADYFCVSSGGTTVYKRSPFMPTETGILRRAGRAIKLLQRSTPGYNNIVHSPPKTEEEYQAHVAAGLKRIPIPPPAWGGHFLGLVGGDVKTTAAGTVLHTGPTTTPVANGKPTAA